MEQAGRQPAAGAGRRVPAFVGKPRNSGVFDGAAVEAVEAWRFEPGRHEGTPVAVRVRQTLVFDLE